MNSSVKIDNKEVVISGTLFRRGRLRAEYYETVEDPKSFLDALKQSGSGADLFTFLQGAADRTPKFQYHMEWDRIAVLPITTYDAWWKSLKDKTRNMVRKGAKAGLEIKIISFDEALVRGIKELYDESPVRQGKLFTHYGKSLEMLKRDHESYLERSEFIGAYFQGKLVGFIKLVFGNNVANLMQIFSFVSHRDKAPTNALIAKSVEICAQKQIPNLHYGMWSRRGIGEFKINHRFECVEVPRYFVPMTWKGQLVLKGGLHHPVSNYLPVHMIDLIASWRSKWYAMRFQRHTATGN